MYEFYAVNLFYIFYLLSRNRLDDNIVYYMQNDLYCDNNGSHLYNMRLSPNNYYDNRCKVCWIIIHDNNNFSYHKLMITWWSVIYNKVNQLVYLLWNWDRIDYSNCMHCFGQVLAKLVRLCNIWMIWKYRRGYIDIDIDGIWTSDGIYRHRYRWKYRHRYIFILKIIYLLKNEIR